MAYEGERGGGGNLLMIGLLVAGGYFLYEWFRSASAPVAAAPGPTPGTTPAMAQGQQSTTVSTVPTTTPATAPAGPSVTIQTVAANMAQSLGQTTGTADQWNFVFRQIMGQGIDQKYKFSFDAVYGPVVRGVRNNGATMSALTFLQLAASSVPGGLPGLTGFGAIARFPGLYMNTQGNMIYLAHHPLPYTPTYNLRGFRGMGAFTQASGFEKALWAGSALRSNRVQ